MYGSANASTPSPSTSSIPSKKACSGPPNPAGAQDLHHEGYGSTAASTPSPSTWSTPSNKANRGSPAPAGAQNLHREVYGSANESKPSPLISSTLADVIEHSRQSCLARSLVVGTNCSSMEVPIRALQKLKVDSKHDLVATMTSSPRISLCVILFQRSTSTIFRREI